MKICMTTDLMGPEETLRAGEEYELADQRGVSLVNAGYAVAVHPPSEDDEAPGEVVEVAPVEPTPNPEPATPVEDETPPQARRFKPQA
jgi:hypothetical protein